MGMYGSRGAAQIIIRENRRSEIHNGKAGAVQTRAQVKESEAKPKPMKVMKGVLNEVGPLKLKEVQETDTT